MPPKFRLQPVLEYRHTLVELLEVELGQLVIAEQRGRTTLEALKSTQVRLFDDLQRSQVGEVDLVLVDQIRNNLNILRSQITKQHEYLEELHLKIKEKQTEVITAKQDEEALVTLKNKELARYQAEQNQKELRLQDDIYIAQAYRKSVDADSSVSTGS